MAKDFVGELGLSEWIEVVWQRAEGNRMGKELGLKCSHLLWCFFQTEGMRAESYREISRARMGWRLFVFYDHDLPWESERTQG